MSEDTLEKAPFTAPESFSIQIRGWGEDEAAARELGEVVGHTVRALSRLADLSALDAVTVAGDYHQALAELDRGYQTEHILTASDDDAAIGVAMAASVIRDGQLKSDIVVNAHFAAGLLDTKSDLFGFAFHTLMHECAHVEITAAFERCFPGVLLRKPHECLHQKLRWDTILGCWDEYAATRISAGIGEDPTEGYENTFIAFLEGARERANETIRAYRLHHDHGRVLAEVYFEYGCLMKFASYHLGNLDGQGLQIEDRAASQAALEDHWFAPFVPRLRDALRGLFDTFGAWEAEDLFHVVGDIADDVVEDGGVSVTDHGGGNLHVHVPFTLETM